MNFEVLEHTADIGFRAWGDTLAEMMANAGMALASIAMEVEGVEERESYPIAARGDDLESLLVNWLNEILFYIDGRQVAMRRIEMLLCSEEQVAGLGWGEARSEKHQMRLIVKGVTYHQLKVEQASEGWQCEVYLDV